MKKVDTKRLIKPKKSFKEEAVESQFEPDIDIDLKLMDEHRPLY